MAVFKFFSQFNNGQVKVGRGAPVFLVTGIAIVLVITATLFSMEHIKTRTYGEVSNLLDRSLEAAIESVAAWQQEKKADTIVWSDSIGVQNAARLLLEHEGHREYLLDHAAQKALRRNMESALREHGYLDYFLLSANEQVLSSSDDSMIGRRNGVEPISLALHRVVTEGEAVFLNPQNAKDMKNAIGEGNEKLAAVRDRIIVVAAPIKNQQGRVDAVLAIVIDPLQEFPLIFQRKRIRLSSEVYAFDRHARMLSESRFSDQLRAIGLISPEDKGAAFNLIVRDPGGDMTKGFVPEKVRDEWPLTLMAQDATSGWEGKSLEPYNDYRGVPVVGVWRWSDRIGVGVAAEVDFDEVYGPFSEVRQLMVAGAGMSIGLLCLISLFYFFNRKKVEGGQQRLRSILENVVDGLITIGEDGAIESVNPATAHIFGYDRSEMIGRNVKMLMPEPYNSAHDGYLRNYMETGDAKIIGIGREVQGRRRDGSIFPLELGVSEFSADGRRMFLGIVRDVTERHLANERLQSILENVVDGLITISKDGVIESVNPATAHIFGYDRSEMIGRNVKMLMPEPYNSAHDGYLRNYMETGEAKIIGIGREVRGRRKDGSVFPLELGVSEFSVSDGGRMFLGIVRDVSERLRAQERLKHSESNLSKAQSIAHIGSWSWNIPTGDLFWSDEIYRIFGLEPQQFDATYDAFMAAVHPEDREAVQNAVSESLESKHPYNITHRIVHPNGAVRIVEEQGEAEYDGSGAPLYMNGIVQDVTDRLAADKLKREFVSTVSHELRTPLTAIHGSHGLLLGGAAGELGDQARALLSIAHENSDRLIRLINDILDIEKLEAGKMGFEMAEGDLVEMVRKSIASNDAYAQKHDVTFLLALGVEAGEVYVDEDRLAQVMTNFLSNGAKFSPAGGAVEVSIVDEGEAFRVSVADHGPGIPEEFKDRIFQRFAQADSSDTRKKGGTGLGLSITKAIIEHMGGAVGFETAPDQGTTFWFTLPKAGTASMQISQGKERSIGGTRILICEDDKGIAHILREQMEGLGFETDIAFNGASAKAMLEKNSYHAMTLDMVLPDMDGVSLIHWIRANDKTQDLPVVVVSAVAEESKERINGGAVQLVDWIKKPIDQDRLAKTIGSAVLSRRSQKPQILHVEDDADIAQLVRVSMEGVCEVTTAPTLGIARELLAAQAFDLILLDVTLPDGSGLSLLPEFKADGENSIPVIIFSAADFDATVAQDVTAILTKSKDGIDDIMKMVKGLVGK